MSDNGAPRCRCPGCRDEAVQGGIFCPFCDEAPYHLHCGTCGRALDCESGQAGTCGECGGHAAADPNAKVRLGNLYLDAGRLAEARSVLFEAAADFANQGLAAKALAVLRKAVNAGEAGPEVLWRAAELAGWTREAADWWRRAGQSLEKAGTTDRSRQAFEKAREIDRIYVKKGNAG